MLRAVHGQLRVDGRARVPHVRRRRGVPGDAEPPRGAAELQDRHLHHADQPAVQVRADGDADRDGRRGEDPRRRRLRRLGPGCVGGGEDAAGAQHGGRGAGGALLRVPDGARGVAAQRGRVHAAALRLLRQGVRAAAARRGGRGDRRDPGAGFAGGDHRDLLVGGADYPRAVLTILLLRAAAVVRKKLSLGRQIRCTKKIHACSKSDSLRLRTDVH